MNSRSSTIAVGVFSDREKAEAAIDELLDEGFPDSQIGVVTRQTETSARRLDDDDDSDDEGDSAATGAITGAAAGAGIGGLIGLGVLSGVIPIVGPALFAGTLGVLASNAAGGAAVAGLVGALTGWGISEDDARHYEKEIVAGRVVVTVTAGSRTEDARAILSAHGATTKETEVSSNR